MAAGKTIEREFSITCVEFPNFLIAIEISNLQTHTYTEYNMQYISIFMAVAKD